MSAPIQDGRPLFSDTIRAEDIQADLEGRNGGLRPGATKPTPAQARARAEDRYVGDDLPPGYERGTAVVSPELTGAPRPHRDETQPHEAWARIDAAKEQGTEAASASPSKSAAAKVIQDVKAHAARAAADFVAAKGTPRQAAARADLEAATALVKRTAEKL